MNYIITAPNIPDEVPQQKDEHHLNKLTRNYINQPEVLKGRGNSQWSHLVVDTPFIVD